MSWRKRKVVPKWTKSRHKKEKDWFLFLSSKIIVRRTKRLCGFLASVFHRESGWRIDLVSHLSELLYDDYAQRADQWKDSVDEQNLKPNCYCGQIEIHFAWILLTNNISFDHDDDHHRTRQQKSFAISLIVEEVSKSRNSSNCLHDEVLSKPFFSLIRTQKKSKWAWLRATAREKNKVFWCTTSRP